MTYAKRYNQHNSAMSTNEKPRPGWVTIALWGLPNRAAARFCSLLAVLLALGCLVAGFWDLRWFGGVAFFGAAMWYWAAIEWVDRYGRW
jgi:hypothetical protein